MLIGKNRLRMTETTESPPQPRRPRGVLEIFLGFSAASISGFGGVLPYARRMIVEERRWMTAEEFNEAFSLSQFVPGPNMLNFAVLFGARYGGPLGALAAAAGLVVPPVVIVMALGALYARYGSLPAIQGILEGLAASAAGLIIAAAAKMTEPLLRRAAGPAPYVAAAVFVAIGLLRWPMLWVLIAAAPLSVLLAWWWRR
jgi:chromate transporter